MKKINSICSFILISALIFVSCAGLRNRVRPERDVRMASEVRFDPLGFPGDDEVVTGRSGRRIVETSGIDSVGQITPDSSNQSITGATGDRAQFRVQVYSTKSFDDAQQYSSTIKNMFPEGVSVEYQVPYYKVQVGQFNNSADGQFFLEKVKQLGFENAWLVRIIQ
jgi:hypothetical protein